MECYLCLANIDGAKNKLKRIKCGAAPKRCDNYLCLGCLVHYFRRCRDEKQRPVCPIRTCRNHFLVQDLSALDDSDIAATPLRLYEIAVFSYYLEHTEKAVNKRINEVNLLEKMQGEHQKFIKTHFPRAIYLTAMITDKKNIRNVKKIKEASEMTTRNYSIPCRTTGCVGVLDENYVCTICETVFCSDCDRIKTENHECKSEDLESMAALEKTVKCPKCKTPVERSEGCDNMTCAACGEKFLYSTGESGGSGGHIHYVGRERLSFYDSVSDLIEKSKKPKLFARLISDIEECRPDLAKSDPGIEGDFSTKQEKRIEGILFKYRQGEINKSEAKSRVVKAFKVHCVQLDNYRTYLRHLNEIEIGLREGTLTVKLLRQIWEQYCDEDD